MALCLSDGEPREQMRSEAVSPAGKRSNQPNNERAAHRSAILFMAPNRIWALRRHPSRTGHLFYDLQGRVKGLAIYDRKDHFPLFWGPGGGVR